MDVPNTNAPTMVAIQKNGATFTLTPPILNCASRYNPTIWIRTANAIIRRSVKSFCRSAAR